MIGDLLPGEEEWITSYEMKSRSVARGLHIFGSLQFAFGRRCSHVGVVG